MPIGPGSRLDGYDVVTLLGSGGMGEVWLARDLTLERMVALKMLSPDLTRDPVRVTRFRQEARAASALNHPNVCTIHALGETPDGQQFIAMERIEGETLRQHLAGCQLPLREAIDVAVQVASALSAAHAAGVVHRDLKPENVMLRPDGFVKVLDFGLAKLAPVGPELAGAGATHTVVRTDAGTVVGTVAYMSPEQARGLEVDARTDIWSLGVMLYEMFAGRSPFAGQSSSDVLAAILDREPAPLARFNPDVPRELQRIVGKTLRKDREQRYQVMKDLLLDLQALRDDPAAKAGPNAVEPEVTDAEGRSLPPQERVRARTAGSQSSAEYVVTRLAAHKVGAVLVAGALVLLVGGAWRALRDRSTGTDLVRSAAPVDRKLTKLTFAPGLQTDVTWSPDGQFIAYASDQSGNFDIWVQPVRGGNAAQVTQSPSQERQPRWSPVGNNIVFRSERNGGGLYVVPAFGGPERQLTTFGGRPNWTRDGACIVFASNASSDGAGSKLYMVGLDGRPAQQILQRFTDGLLFMGAWALHPDGRVSVIGQDRTQREGLFTVPVSGGATVLSKDSTDRSRQPGLTGGFEWFDWSPTGTAYFIERVDQWKTDLWRFAVNPQTLEQTTAERLITGGSVHTGPAISHDGRTLAFSMGTQTVRLWSFPLDAGAGRITGPGKPITEAGARVLTSDLTRDGRRLAYVLAREGAEREELWLTELASGSTKQISIEEVQGWGQWSPDGTRLAYPVMRWNKTRTQGETAVMVRDVDGGGEQPVTTFKALGGNNAWAARRSNYISPWDWSANGEALIVGSDQFTPPYFSLYLLPLDAAPHAETAAKPLASDPAYNLWQANASPNGRWIAFMAQSRDGTGAATVAVIPSAGAASSQWTRLTDARGWADKPRWSPDGKLLYFILRQASFYNVWALRFNPETGRAIGAAFQVTHFDSPGHQFSTRLAYSELSISSTRLIVPIMETTGNIWMLDNVDR